MAASSFDFENPNPSAGGPSLSSATPAAVGTAAAGSGTEASKDDHVHAHGNQSGGTLHSAANSSMAGFMSAADKAAHDAIAAAPAIPLSATFSNSATITGTQGYIVYNGRHSSSQFQLGSTGHRVFLPAGAKYRLVGGVQGTVSSGFTVHFSIWTSATASGTFAEDTASALDFVNADGANPNKAGTTYTVPSGGRYVQLGAIYLGGTSGSSVALTSACQLERVN